MLQYYNHIHIFGQTLKKQNHEKNFINCGSNLLGMSSCKKDYTCECTTAYPSGSQTVSFTVNAKKKDADAACTALQTTVQSGTTTITQSCKIK